MADQIDLFSAAGVEATPPSADFDPAKIPTSAKVPIPPGTYESLDPLAAHCKSCQRCELAETRTNVVVSQIGRAHV